ncbi:MAG: tetratricopeptide repeat protein [Deltaproteobacteria bacterium]|nr:tetratricopeptide repeat protein [Deltaproteobacteria bacterium]
MKQRTNRRDVIWNRIVRAGVGVSLLGLIACGGGSGSGGGGTTPAATDESGRTIHTAGGEGVTEEAHNRWTSGMEAFNGYETNGWNEQACGASIASFEAANEAQGGHFAEALYMAGLSADRCHDGEKSRRFYNQALQANQTFCRARVGLGLLDLARGNVAGARGAFQRAIHDDPQCTSGYVNLAIVQRRAGGADNLRQALSNLRRGLAIDSNYLPAFSEMALLYLDQSRTNDREVRQSSLDLAEVVCRQAQLIDRNYAPIYNTWGLAKMRKGDIIEALRLFERAVALDDDMFEAHMNFAEITLSFRGYEDARRSFARAVALRPQSYDAVIGLGAAQRGLEHFDQAKAQYEHAIELDSNRPEAYYNLGVLYHNYMDGTVPMLERAKGYFQQFVEKAGSRRRYAAPLDLVQHHCREERNNRRRRGRRGRRARRRSRRRNACRMGRIQLIDFTIAAMREGEAMQREAEQMQREADAQQQQMEQQQQQGEGGATPEGGAAAPEGGGN